MHSLKYVWWGEAFKFGLLLNSDSMFFFTRLFQFIPYLKQKALSEAIVKSLAKTARGFLLDLNFSGVEIAPDHWITAVQVQSSFTVLSPLQVNILSPTDHHKGNKTLSAWLTPQCLNPLNGIDLFRTSPLGYNFLHFKASCDHAVLYQAELEPPVALLLPYRSRNVNTFCHFCDRWLLPSLFEGSPAHLSLLLVSVGVQLLISQI